MSVRERPVRKRIGVLRPENMMARVMLAKERMPRRSAIRETRCLFLVLYHVLGRGAG